MTSNLKRMFLTSFIVIYSLFFINIDDVEAARAGESKTGGPGYGYAQCTYLSFLSTAIDGFES